MSVPAGRPDPAAAWTPRPTLPGHAYHDPAVWAEEQERIFAAEWICVGREEELPAPGTYLVRDVAQESVLLTRAKDGTLAALFDTCTHRGTRLLDGQGELRSGVIKCPYHSWTFSAAGSCWRRRTWRRARGSTVRRGRCGGSRWTRGTGSCS